MADAKSSPRTTSSPLFDKMDALLARHRGAAEALDIPILFEEALEETSIPTLTDVVQGDELMFQPGDYRPAAHAAPSKAHTPAPARRDEGLFLDMPLFDLDASIEQAPPSAPAKPQLSPEEERDLQVPTIGFIPEPATILPVENLPTLEIPEISFAPETPPVEIPVAEKIDIGPAEDAQDWEDGLSLTEAILPLGDTLVLDTEVEPAGLSEAAITEITASVAAQIAVEVSTEVSQLTRQHFTKMMNSFYSESLRQLTDEISRDMEMCLAPRIEELVRTELQRQGLIQDKHSR